MKKIFFSLVIFLSVFVAFSQNIKLQTFELGNGMNVVLCEDHNQPQIYGAICVHVGSKNDPADNTGMAHYLEHIMFKGTDKIGTLNWGAEKVFLDSITVLYDELHGITDKKQRERILLHINQLSNKATEYAIPNEVDVILDKMGGKEVNAFTSNDVTVYYNQFPSNQLEKWLTVYAERFRNPIFRLFQSELEAVYEEYNMYHDNFLMVFMEDALAAAYGDHPYGRPVIGYQQHLKNPQPSAMQTFFNTYYHPANMTLVLVGDFVSSEIHPMIEGILGQMPNKAAGVDVRMSRNTNRFDTDLHQKIEPFNGHQIVNFKETPVKMGVVGFQTTGTNDKTSFYLDIMSSLLNNESGTGLLDKLGNENQLLGAQGFNYGMLENGMFAFFYVPKILGQSHEQAEELIFAVIDSLKTGNFSNQLFNAVKMDYLTDYLMGMESLNDKFYEVLDMVTNKQDVSFLSTKEQMIRNLSKKDLVDIANRFFGNDCMIIRSGMGVKKMEKLKKPNWTPVVAKNTEEQSEFAKIIEKMPVKDVESQDVSLEKEVVRTQINDSYALYSSKNPMNDIFTLTLVFNYGTFMDEKLETAINYFNLQGTQNQSFTDFQLELQGLGALMDVWASDEKTYVSISGFDKDFAQILLLCHDKFFTPGNDESKLSTLIEELKNEQQMRKNDAEVWGDALFNYALYGENSPYLRSLTLDELKSVSGKELLESFLMIRKYDGYVTYVGNSDVKFVSDFLREKFGLSEKTQHGERIVAPLTTHKEPTIFVASNKHFLQSNIYFYIQGQKVNDLRTRMLCQAYNAYMSGSMAGIIFQEIRELRSLGYSAYGAVTYDPQNRRPGYIYGYLGTQADKTVEGCTEMMKLLANFPRKSEKFDNAKIAAVKKMESSYINFRDYPAQYVSWKELGYSKDPRKEQMDLMRNFTLDEVGAFHYKMVEKSAPVITIAGDKKRMKLKSLQNQYKIIEVKYEDIIR